MVNCLSHPVLIIEYAIDAYLISLKTYRGLTKQVKKKRENLMCESFKTKFVILLINKSKSVNWLAAPS